MARSQETFGKKEREKKKKKKKEDRMARRDERKSNSSDGTLENMMAYIDEDGNITNVPPDPTKKKKVIDASTIEIGVPKRAEEDEVDNTRIGKVTYFNSSKGYGFIKDEKSGDDIFVHINGVEGGVMAQGDKVSFEVERGPKGLTAVRVKQV